jgi:hypothetical protein
MQSDPGSANIPNFRRIHKRTGSSIRIRNAIFRTIVVFSLRDSYINSINVVSHFIRVKAINDEGESEPLEGDKPFKAKNPFGKFICRCPYDILNKIFRKTYHNLPYLTVIKLRVILHEVEYETLPFSLLITESLRKFGMNMPFFLLF